MTFSTNEVSRLSGATLRQLQWWDDHGWLSPARVKADRAYSERQTLSAMIMMNLRKRGMTPKQIIACEANGPIPGFARHLIAGPGVSLVCALDEFAIQLANESSEAVWIVPVAEFRRRIEEFARERQ